MASKGKRDHYHREAPQPMVGDVARIQMDFMFVGAEGTFVDEPRAKGTVLMVICQDDGNLSASSLLTLAPLAMSELCLLTGINTSPRHPDHSNPLLSQRTGDRDLAHTCFRLSKPHGLDLRLVGPILVSEILCLGLRQLPFWSVFMIAFDLLSQSSLAS